ncbi:type IV toxin-antitoxin system AbiEi family antitoxin domain-containing protein [Aeromicrobium sp. CF4.19]|uniref:type IV toxin-antitoxin system AbiEi family antitoxin domain-containing protein n=1 Tax=Aeromicrobium sp. CF4.19 TaxID=3373082 RepID=UPI003EE5EE62
MQHPASARRPFTPAQAHDHGLTSHDLAMLVESGAVRRPLRGVYVDAEEPDTRELRIACVELIKPPHAVACSETAAWLYQIDAFKPSEQHLLVPSFLVPHAESRMRRDEASCRQAHLNPHDITTVDGVATTTPLRTASDLLRRSYRPYAFAAGDAFLRAGLVEHGELVHAVYRLKGYPGIVQARSLVTRLDARAESPGESWQRLRILDAGFPTPELQIVVVDAMGVERRLDMGYRRLLVASEYDGREFHTIGEHRARDEERRHLLTVTHGWRWVNATRARIFGADTSFEDELGGLLHQAPRPRTWGRGSSRLRVPTAGTMSPRAAGPWERLPRPPE